MNLGQYLNNDTIQSEKRPISESSFFPLFHTAPVFDRLAID
jgi:hypothetical protein